jgi:GNAT superfamily N-acetyltransferase
MEIRISLTPPEKLAVSTFLMSMHVFAPATHKMLFSDGKWRAVEKVAIAYDVREMYAVGIAGLIPPNGTIDFGCGSVAAIWVSPEARRKGVGLALLQELSSACGNTRLEMSIWSRQAAYLCAKAKAQGIRLWKTIPDATYQLVTMA